MSEATGTPRTLNPLWIVSVFLGVSQAAMTLAATQTTGLIQVIFTVFAVAYSSVVTIFFFVVLWSKNHVLYAPGDFQGNVSPAQFVDAMSNGRSHLQAQHAEVTRRDAILETALRDVGGEALVEQVAAVRKESQVHVDISAVVPGGQVSFTATEETTVQELLNVIYFAIDSAVMPFSYGEEWQLVDAATGRSFSHLGSRRFLNGSEGDDDRYLREVGIAGGMTLSVQLLGASRGDRVVNSHP